MRSLKGLSTTLLGGGMVAMLSFSWLPMMTDEMLIGPDKFGIEAIYPVANNGSVWYINNEDPQSDNNFYFRSLEDIDLDRQEGRGEFKMDAETGTEKHGVRIHVDSPKGVWKNVEMSGYFKLVEGQDQFTMIARHGPSYEDNEGCDAYGYYGILSA